MAADEAQTKLQCHVAVYENVMCHTSVHVRESECAYVYVINEKEPFQDFHYLINRVLLIYQSNFNNLCHVRLFAYVFMQVTWRRVESPITRFNQEHRSSLQ